jgi:hypothetical protein
MDASAARSAAAPDASHSEPRGGDSRDAAAAAPSDTFGDCDAMLAYVRNHAQELTDASPIGAPYGKALGCPGGCDVFTTVFNFAPSSWTRLEGEGGFGGLLQVSGDRVFGVDVDRLFSAPITKADGKLSMLDETTFGRRIFVAGHRLLSVDLESPLNQPGRHPTSIVEVDISDPEAMRVVRTRELNGTGVDAKMIDGKLRILIQSEPDIDWQLAGDVGLTGTAPNGDPADVAAARDHNRTLIDESTEEQWLPAYTDRSPDGTVTGSGRILDCSAVHHPVEPGGVGLLTWIEIDVADGLDSARADGLFADSAQVYATSDRVVVATRPWRELSGLWSLSGAEIPTGARTLLHVFDAAGGGMRSLGNAAIDGYIVDLAMMNDERLAALTIDWNIWDGLDADAPESLALSIMEVGTEGLAQIGRSDPFMAKWNSVRNVTIAGAVGYLPSSANEVATRWVDLKDARHPAVRDDIDLTGPWLNLYPWRETQVLALGREVDSDWNYDQAKSFVARLDATKVTTNSGFAAFTPDRISDPDAFAIDDVSETLVTCGLVSSGDLIVGHDCFVFDISGDGSPPQLGTIQHPTPPPNYGYRYIQSVALSGDRLVTSSNMELRVSALPSLETIRSFEMPLAQQ